IDRHRDHIRTIRAAVDNVADTAHSNVRNYRNWLLIVGTVLVAGLVVLAIAHATHPSFLFICQATSSSDASCQSAGANVFELEAAGALGGLLTALFSLIRLRVYSGPYSLPLWQALIRLPAGAAGGLL